MNTAAKVASLMDEWKREGIPATTFVIRLANACIGWCYIFGAAGEYCSPANRRAFYNSKKKETIKTKCKNFEGSGYDGCSGCRWYPGGRTRAFDCRGFTRWLFKQVGIVINGSGATRQYNDDSNWSEKGQIENMPKDKICCTFRYDKSTGKYEHTLLYDGAGNYIHDNGEVRKIPISKYKATHYAIPKGLYEGGDVPVPEPTPTPTPEPEPVPTPVKYSTIRRGSRGDLVKLLQTTLVKQGFNLDVDGIFGPQTQCAVMNFQRRYNLEVDGIVGPKTWGVLKRYI